MKGLQKLAGQTAIYGLPSIIGRLLNYLLVPLHVSVFVPERFGVITEMYSYVAFLVVFLTYGMETAFFRFQSKLENKSQQVFSTVLVSLLSSSFVFVAICSYFSQNIANFIDYPENSEYVIWFALIVGLDAVASIPLAQLRAQNRAIRFASINMINILVNIGLNLFWMAYCMPEFEKGTSNFLINNFYSPSIGVGYVFLANLFASGLKFLLLTPSFLKIKMTFDRALWKEMIKYSTPLLIASLAIIVNESVDKIMLKWMLKDELGIEGASRQVGIYGACYKLSIIISLFIQAFRYAAEPFFFAQAKDSNAKDTYAQIAKYFIIVCSIILLVVILYLDILKFFIPNESYWEGLGVVPILLYANLFLGLFYNLSIWYKLSEKTQYGAIIASVGAVITISLNFILIPKIGYMGSAWATFCCYLAMVIISYLLGQKHYSIPYDIKRMTIYLTSTFLLIQISYHFVSFEAELFKYAFNTSLLLVFIGLVYVLEKPKKAIIS